MTLTQYADDELLFEIEKEADMRTLILSIRDFLFGLKTEENIVYKMFFATIFLLIYITTNIGG